MADDDDVEVLIDISENEWWCPHHRRHHRRHEHLFVDLLLGTQDPNKEQIDMAETVLNVTPQTTAVDGSLGSVRDAEGNVSPDTVVSGTWAVDNPALGSIAVPDGLTSVLALTGAEGTLNVSFTGQTAAGQAVTGAGQVVCAVGPATTVDLVLTAEAPAPAPAPVPPAPPAA
jgi:hypothetical protein